MSPSSESPDSQVVAVPKHPLTAEFPVVSVGCSGSLVFSRKEVVVEHGVDGFEMDAVFVAVCGVLTCIKCGVNEMRDAPVLHSINHTAKVTALEIMAACPNLQQK